MNHNIIETKQYILYISYRTVVALYDKTTGKYKIDYYMEAPSRTTAKHFNQMLGTHYKQFMKDHNI